MVQNSTQNLKTCRVKPCREGGGPVTSWSHLIMDRALLAALFRDPQMASCTKAEAFLLHSNELY